MTTAVHNISEVDSDSPGPSIASLSRVSSFCIQGLAATTIKHPSSQLIVLRLSPTSLEASTLYRCQNPEDPPLRLLRAHELGQGALAGTAEKARSRLSERIIQRSWGQRGYWDGWLWGATAVSVLGLGLFIVSGTLLSVRKVTGHWSVWIGIQVLIFWYFSLGRVLHDASAVSPSDGPGPSPLRPSPFFAAPRAAAGVLRAVYVYVSESGHALVLRLPLDIDIQHLGPPVRTRPALV